MNLIMFMYHRVLPEEHPEAVTCELFRKQLDYMLDKFHVLSPSEVTAFLRTGALPAGIRKNCAALSFDDGYLDNMLYADPILKEKGCAAMMAVSAGFRHSGEVRETESIEILNRDHSAICEACKNKDYRNYLNEQELRYLEKSGRWSLEAHGTRHALGAAGKSVLCAPQGCTPVEFGEMLRKDILNCRRYLEALTGREGHVFFWPYGHYSTAAAEIVRECGYDIQFTVSKGVCKGKDPRLCLPRIGVSRWKKFHKNCIVFSNPVLRAFRSLFPNEQVCFDEFWEETGK